MKTRNLISLVTLMALVVSFSVIADDDDDDRGWFRSSQFKSESYKMYKAECGDACHIAFPVSMLVKSDWRNIMASLDNHFGDNAELDEADSKTILAYLEKYGANNMYRSKSSNSLRITDTRNFRHEHDELSSRYVGKKAKVKSFADCKSCHIKADQGSYNERDIRVPGVGRWED